MQKRVGNFIASPAERKRGVVLPVVRKRKKMPSAEPAVRKRKKNNTLIRRGWKRRSYQACERKKRRKFRDEEKRKASSINCKRSKLCTGEEEKESWALLKEEEVTLKGRRS